MAPRYQIDLCDEIGLMVYQENYAVLAHGAVAEIGGAVQSFHPGHGQA